MQLLTIETHRVTALRAQGEGVMAIAQHLADEHQLYAQAVGLHQQYYMPLVAEAIKLAMCEAEGHKFVLLVDDVGPNSASEAFICHICGYEWGHTYY